MALSQVQHHFQNFFSEFQIIIACNLEQMEKHLTELLRQSDQSVISAHNQYKKYGLTCFYGI